MKNIAIISFLLFVGSYGFGQDIKFVPLETNAEEFRRNSPIAQCEMTFNSPKIYKSWDEISKGKQNKFIKWAKKCDCNIVYMDYKGLNTYESTQKKGVFFFYAICTKE